MEKKSSSAVKETKTLTPEDILAAENHELKLRLADLQKKQSATPAAPTRNHTTAKGYTVPPGEEETVHVKIERVRYETNSPKKLSEPYIQKFDPNGWTTVLENHMAHGITIHEVLHLPEGAMSLEEYKKLEAARIAKAKANAIKTTPR